MNKSYRELYEKLMDMYKDEKGIVRGESVMMLYRISRYAESVGFDSIVDDKFADLLSKVSK